MTICHLRRLRRARWVPSVGALCVAVLGLAVVASCARKGEPDDSPPRLQEPASSAATPTTASPSAAPIATACPSDMVLAEGLYCPQLEQRCQTAPNQTAPASGNTCQRYLPSRCLTAQKQLLRVCIDRYEWPNQLGQKPLVLVGFDEAQQLCESAGKRLCDEQEWSFACEGEHLLPYSYGYERDPTRCVIDRLANKPSERWARYDECMDNDRCREAFSEIDQREPTGTFRGCVSPVGAHDMTGNVSEWVRVLGPKPGHATKGGYWGPGPDQCRATTPAKKPLDAKGQAQELSPELGFRCCRNASPG
ncbi:MAG TPA: SUMF1/EgtB/PvdO family nonheme iron enzyme [Polyangiaceae bacterium]|nr:SUMF1/EgtB/PvdO family nonheme iron enzyme [Polyangiaceae bacterium]